MKPKPARMIVAGRAVLTQDEAKPDVVVVELQTKRREPVSIEIPAAQLEKWVVRQFKAEMFA